MDKICTYFGRFKELLEEFYVSPYRGAVARARRDEDDLFMLFVFGELMGIPNPATYYTLELQPLLLERFHDWHRRRDLSIHLSTGSAVAKSPYRL